MGALNGQLLEAWLRPPLSFIFLFSASQLDFKVELEADLIASSWESQGSQSLFQRLKGWVLSSKDGQCLIALREEQIYWYESRLAYGNARDPAAHVQQMRVLDELRRCFYQV